MVTHLPASVSRYLDTQRPMLLGGEWLGSVTSGWKPTVNPADGKVIGEYAVAGEAEVNQAVVAAREAFDNGNWGEVTPAQRAKLLWRVADLIEAQGEELASLETLDGGKLLSGVRNGEIPSAAESFRYYAGWCTKMEGRTPQISIPGMKFHAYTQREPIGVVAQIVPWNGPLVMAAWKLAPALATGCTCILKPAEQTPMSTLLLGELFEQAGIPSGVVNIVTGDGKTGNTLVQHPGVDKIAFTGSTATARKILVEASGNLKKVSLELGGKSPVIVFADADMEQAIAGAAESIFNNAGQVCVAGSRLLVERSVFEQVVDGVSKIAKSLKLGSGFDPKSQMGPLISEEHRNHVHSLVESGIRDGAEFLSGGKLCDGEGYFYEPTVLASVRSEMAVVQEEIFGPVVTAMPFDDPDEVAALANDTPYGLAGSIWTRDVSKAHHMAASIRAGLLWINCHGIPDMAVPFGGFKQSGWERENGWEGLEKYTELKSVLTLL